MRASLNLGIFLGLMLAAVSETAFSACSQEIRIGWDTSDPYQMKVGASYSGLDLDLLQSILNKMGCRYQFINQPWKRILSGVERGQIDITASAVKSPEREVYAFFSDAYIETRNLIMTRTAEASTFSALSLNDFGKIQGFRLGVCLGFDYGKNFRQAVKDPAFNSILETADNEEQGLRMLVGKRINGFVIDEFSGLHIARKLEVRQKVELHPLVVEAVSSYVMFSKKSLNVEFKDQFNRQLQQLRESGEHGRILAKYRN